MKVMTIIGTRPEIIKMSRIIPLLDAKFEHTFVFSGQHYSDNMVDIFFKQLGVRKPDRFLDVKSSEYADLLRPMIQTISDVDPEYVIVYGDTNSTLAAALAAKRMNKKIIHIEAGLRSFDKRMLEEFNRIITDHMSDYNFTPTRYTKKLLDQENLTKNVFIVGNTIVDAVYASLPEVEKSDILDRLNLKSKDYFLLTLHRQELVDSPEDLKKIINVLGACGKKIVYPIHPRTEKRLAEFGFKLPENVIAIKPLGYFEFLKLLKEATLVMTDSGGVQEESITLKTPCISLMYHTERMETVEAGVNILVGYDEVKIKDAVNKILTENIHEKIKDVPNPYGDGTASKKIVDFLEMQISQ